MYMYLCIGLRLIGVIVWIMVVREKKMKDENISRVDWLWLLQKHFDDLCCSLVQTISFVMAYMYENEGH